MSRLVNSLKNFSRVDEAVFQRVDIREGVERALVLVQIAEHVEVVREYGPVEQIYCAPGQINQMIYNVLKNAASAVAHRGGKIGIRTFQDGADVCLVIWDTGPGISQDVLDRIFEFQFTASDTRVKMGSGLASAYDIALQHGGDITIESEEGTGTAVRIRVPVRWRLHS